MSHNFSQRRLPVLGLAYIGALLVTIGPFPAHAINPIGLYAGGVTG